MGTQRWNEPNCARGIAGSVEIHFLSGVLLARIYALGFLRWFRCAEPSAREIRGFTAKGRAILAPIEMAEYCHISGDQRRLLGCLYEPLIIANL